MKSDVLFIANQSIFQLQDLSATEKLVLSYIHSLSFNGSLGKCIVSNERIDEVLGLCKGRAANMVPKLIKAGYVKKIGFDGRVRELVTDYIHICNKCNVDISDSVEKEIEADDILKVEKKANQEIEDKSHENAKQKSKAILQGISTEETEGGKPSKYRTKVSDRRTLLKAFNNIVDKQKEKLTLEEKAVIATYFYLDITNNSKAMVDDDIVYTMELLNKKIDIDTLIYIYWKAAHEKWTMGLIQKYKNCKGIDYIYKKLITDINKENLKKFCDRCKYELEVTQKQKDILNKINYLLISPPYDETKPNLSKGTRGSKRMFTRAFDPTNEEDIKKAEEHAKKAQREMQILIDQSKAKK